MVQAIVHLERIVPGRAPGGVWIRVCTIDRVLTEYALTDARQVTSAAALDGDLALAAGDPVWVYFYDGDSGVCMRTIIAG
jgi:hypothetical protein